ncbi:hypothetical protein UPYG_G00022540 [Umbra pygmaea]|uniref:Uncharacterized protein n=1 Tax=Umbra pygmaea TaxID=75934 RepID=A0ABD0YA75_UMBPY
MTCRRKPRRVPQPCFERVDVVLMFRSRTGAAPAHVLNPGVKLVSGDWLAGCSITLSLALELLFYLTTPLPLHPIPTWNHPRCNSLAREASM